VKGFFFDPAYLFLPFVYSIFTLLFAVTLMDKLIFSRYQLSLLDRYAESGVEVVGFVLNKHVTIRTSSFCCIESSRTYEVQYAYKSSELPDELLVKNKTYFRSNSADPFPERILSVLILPGLALSGTPKWEVDERHSEYGCLSRIIKGFFSGLFVVLGCARNAGILEAMFGAHEWIGYVFVLQIVVFLILVYALGRVQHSSDVESMLTEGESRETSTTDTDTMTANEYMQDTAFIEEGIEMLEAKAVKA